MKGKIFQIIGCLLLLTGLIITGCNGQDTTSQNIAENGSAETNNEVNKTVIECHVNIIQTSLDAMIESADTIVIGKVASILPPRWCDSMINGNEAICTDVIIEADNYLYGQSASKRIAVVVYGGRIGNICMECSDMPGFIRGEDVLLVLHKAVNVETPYSSIQPSDYYTVAGIYQGKFILDGDEVIDYQGNRIKLTEIKQKISKIHGNE